MSKKPDSQGRGTSGRRISARQRQSPALVRRIEKMYFPIYKVPLGEVLSLCSCLFLYVSRVWSENAMPPTQMVDVPPCQENRQPAWTALDSPRLGKFPKKTRDQGDWNYSTKRTKDDGLRVEPWSERQ